MTDVAEVSPQPQPLLRLFRCFNSSSSAWVAASDEAEAEDFFWRASSTRNRDLIRVEARPNPDAVSPGWQTFVRRTGFVAVRVQPGHKEWFQGNQ